MADKTMAHIEMTQAMGDADLGKLTVGRIVFVPVAQADRFKAAGVAKDSTEAAYHKQVEKNEARFDQSGRKGQFEDLSRSNDWDTSTTRDVTMAPEEGIRRAYAQGRLVNTSQLRDDDGMPLPLDASLEQMLAARKNLAYGESELTYHERSSVQGGGSHTAPTFDTLGGKAPLNAPKLSREQRGNAAEADATRRRAASSAVKGNEAPAVKANEEGAKGADGKAAEAKKAD